MKIFKYISLTFLILIFGFFAIGLFSNSISYQNKVIVNAPVEKAFVLFTDTTKMKEWLPGFISFTNDSGGNFNRGSKWKLILLQEGQRYEMEETMTVYEPNKQYSYILENIVLRNYVDVYFKANGNTTEITSHNLIKGNNLIWRSIFFFYEKDLFEKGEKTFEDLKKMIESNK